MFSEDLVFTDNEIGRISSELLNKIIEMRKKRLTKKKKICMLQTFAGTFAKNVR